MFGAKKKEDQTSKKTSMSATSNSINCLVEGTSVEGTINTQNDIRIDGTITGTLICKAKVIIGPKGKIVGDVTCQNAVIEGIFEGSLKVDELLNIRETASITGDISTDKLIVQAGATFNVSCDMGGKNGIKKSSSIGLGTKVANEA